MNNLILKETLTQSLSLPKDAEKLVLYVGSKFKSIETNFRFVTSDNGDRLSKKVIEYFSDTPDLLSDADVDALTKTRDALAISLKPFEVGSEMNSKHDLRTVAESIDQFLSSMPIYPNEDVARLQELYLEDLITKLPMKFIPVLLRKIRQGDFGKLTKRPIQAEIITWGEKELADARGLLWKMEALIKCKLPEKLTEEQKVANKANIAKITSRESRHAA